jgi:hypothetical protein
MNHTHGLHILRACADPVLRACMLDNRPPRERLRDAAMQLQASVDAGEWNRVNDDRKCDLRGLVWFLHEMADNLEPAPTTRARKWWRVW